MGAAGEQVWAAPDSSWTVTVVFTRAYQYNAHTVLATTAQDCSGYVSCYPELMMLWWCCDDDVDVNIIIATSSSLNNTSKSEQLFWAGIHRLCSVHKVFTRAYQYNAHMHLATTDQEVFRSVLPNPEVVLRCCDYVMMMCATSCAQHHVRNIIIAKQHLQKWVPFLSRYWQVVLSTCGVYPSVSHKHTYAFNHYCSGGVQNGYPYLQVA